MLNLHQSILEGLYQGTLGFFFGPEDLQQLQADGSLGDDASKFLVRLTGKTSLYNAYEIEHALTRLEEAQNGSPYRLIMRAGRGTGEVAWKVLDSRQDHDYTENLAQEETLDTLAERVVATLIENGLLENYKAPSTTLNPRQFAKDAIEITHCLYQIYGDQPFYSEDVAWDCAFSAVPSDHQSYPSKRLEGLIKRYTHPTTGITPTSKELDLCLEELSDFTWEEEGTPYVIYVDYEFEEDIEIPRFKVVKA